ncbi:MAG: extracellular solute-binding protein, partial [Acidimicrobiaceae bacterium]|nr:extracellular solute-binding protein [Acidimicrobiaceae bacterium]
MRLLAALLALGLVAAACGDDDEGAQPAPDDSGAAAQPADDDGAAAEPADDDGAAAEPADDSGAAAEPADDGGDEVVTITIESWRTDDAAIWDDQIIPVFEAEFPNINVEFNPTPPADYNAALDTRLVGGTAGDLITCRPFDASLALFDRGDLAPLTDLPGIGGFSPVAQSAWITDDGTTPFCVPMASVIHGFIYNKTAFDE